MKLKRKTVKKKKKLSVKDARILDLIQQNRELDRFVYSASHDLKAPLRSIMGIVNIAKSEEPGEEQLKYLEMINRSAQKLDNFINDLVNYSRNSRLTLESSRIDFADILTDTAESLFHMDETHTLKISHQISSVPFFSDARRIKVIFGNLVSNAVKYQNPEGKEAPELLVTVSVTSSKAKIVFKDNGEGIAKPDQKNIFKMFFRASERSHGSGLGLFIVKEVVKKTEGIHKSAFSSRKRNYLYHTLTQSSKRT